MSKRRLKQELKELEREPVMECTAQPAGNGSDIHLWRATIKGPAGTPYEGGTFVLTMRFRRDYPFQQPRVTFDTPIYHPNINANGVVCLDMLMGQWSPTLTISTILMSICVLLSDANPNKVLVPNVLNIGREYRENREQFNNTAREWTRRHAM
uniref:E2 ubiquitin-conjugating enzyme n=1 Tax=Globodera rostochiensis TaxID=31243 RepID=A0A914I5V8_GLORO